MNSSDVLQKIIKEEDINPNYLAMKMGLSRTQPIYDIINGKIKKISSDYALKIIEAYPRYDVIWLLTGEGIMLKNSDMSLLNDKDFIGVSIPVYNAEASAGSGALRLNNEFIMGKINVPFAVAGDKALTVIGISMIPVVNSGDIIVVRERMNWFEYIELGKMYVIVTNEEVFLKVIKEYDGQRMMLHSYNSEYSDFFVPKECICNVFKVIGTVSQRSF